MCQGRDGPRECGAISAVRTVHFAIWVQYRQLLIMISITIEITFDTEIQKPPPLSPRDKNPYAVSNYIDF